MKKLLLCLMLVSLGYVVNAQEFKGAWKAATANVTVEENGIYVSGTMTIDGKEYQFSGKTDQGVAYIEITDAGKMYVSSGSFKMNGSTLTLEMTDRSGAQKAGLSNSYSFSKN